MNGVYYDLPEAEYRCDPSISQSSLKVLGLSPKKFIACMEPEEDEEEKDCLLLGRLTASLVLEPEKKPWWVVAPEGMKFNTKDGKAFKSAADLPVVRAPMFKKASRMASEIASHPVASQIMADSRREVSVFTTLEGVPVKARIDIVTGGNCLADLKTTRDARPEPFAQKAKRLGYFLQAKFYLDAWNTACPDDPKSHFMLIAIENFPPYDLIVYSVSANDLAEEGLRYRSLLERYKECRSSGVWPGYTTDILTLQSS